MTTVSASQLIADKFTLIVPTFNRPSELARLLGYLARHELQCRLLVLDSSSTAVQEANRATVRRLGERARLESFPPEVSPWAKFLRGSELVETEFCSLCADDDLVLPGSLDALVGFLDTHADYVVAHGWYFTFYDNVHIGITASVYRGASLDHDDPLERLAALFRNYEALTYGVYRTRIVRDVLRDVQVVSSMLARELLGGALSAVLGKAARLPVFYYARSHLPSHPYSHWHPLDYLVSSPDGLYRDYASYRAKLLDCIGSIGYDRFAPHELATIIDLIHFRYLSDYVKPRVMDYLAEQVMARSPKPQIMQGLWSVLARENEPSLVTALSGSNLVRRLRDRYFPRVRLHHLRRLFDSGGQKWVQSTTASGRRRDYLFYKEFIASVAASPQLERNIGTIVAALDKYE